MRAGEQQIESAGKAWFEEHGKFAVNDEVPLKRVMAELCVSRSSLWRAINSKIEGLPAPLVRRGRVFWREEDLPALKNALTRYAGRGAFERDRRHAKVRAAAAAAKVMKRYRAVKPKTSEIRQPDLFGAADSVAPTGAEATTGQG